VWAVVIPCKVALGGRLAQPHELLAHQLVRRLLREHRPHDTRSASGVWPPFDRREELPDEPLVRYRAHPP
tara:strand:+ start:1996 stop:2205 length:210 start_codon:yes stop_codon:yes gene_type:complete